MIGRHMAKSTANKTVPTGARVSVYIAGIKDPEQRKDAKTLLALMRKATGSTPKMWGPSIVGFGSYHYRYASGREGDYCVTGFSARKGMMTVYLLPGLHLHRANLARLGPVKTGQSCVYIKRLSDVHLPTLARMVRQALRDMRKHTPQVGA
jgi:hypothetical protein